MEIAFSSQLNSSKGAVYCLFSCFLGQNGVDLFTEVLSMAFLNRNNVVVANRNLKWKLSM
ncbi:MAG: hypothetical protein IPN95_20050 [Bacteroidetes bacterium]|nr:hypothetical protein [Bacteroidota bacterium]